MGDGIKAYANVRCKSLPYLLREGTLAKKISEEKTWLKIILNMVVYLKKDSLD